MAEANLAASRSSSGPFDFDMTLITPEQFNKLNPFDQRKEYKKIYVLYTMCYEQRKSQSNDTEPGTLQVQEEEDLHDSSPVDQTLVGRLSANPNETSLVEALKEKDVRYAKLEQKANGLSSDLQDREQQLENAAVRIDDMESMVKETEKKLSESNENCNQLIIQVDDLRDELEDRDITIRFMAQSARRDQERNAEISAHMEVLESAQEQVEAENRRLRQQLQEEVSRNQILRNLLQMIARRPLRRRLPDAELSMEMLE